MTEPVAYLMENDESKWLGYEPDPCADWVTPLYKEKWKMSINPHYRSGLKFTVEPTPPLGIGDSQAEITMLKVINKDLSEKIAELVEIFERRARTIEQDCGDWKDSAIAWKAEATKLEEALRRVQQSVFEDSAAYEHASRALGEWK